MKSIDVLIWDEVHKAKKGNSLNDLFKDIKTHHRFGFTGTMPPNLIDAWNVIGHIGPVIYEKTSEELRKEGYISNVTIYSFLLNYKSVPKYTGTSTLPAAKYKAELEFLIQNEFRNNKIAFLTREFSNNSLVLVDFINHGLILTDIIKKAAPNKQVFFIRGEVEIEDRETIKQLIESNKDVVIIAISKIFSTGISIKNLHYIVFVGGGKAKIKTLQSIGRGLRLHQDKQQLTIFDFADMTEYGKLHYLERKKIYNNEKITNKETEITEK
jgi:superfamily II DNA or RNA helicase